MRRIFCAVLVLVLVLSNSSAFALNQKSLTLAIAYDLPDVADMIYCYALNQMGYKVSIVTGGTSSVTRMADSGEIDGLIGRATPIGNNYPNLIQIPVPNYPCDFAVYTRTDSAIEIKTWDDFAFVKTGQLFQKPYVESHLPKDAIITKKSTMLEMLMAISTGELDAGVVQTPEGQECWLPKNVHVESSVDTMNAYAYLNKKNEHLIEPLSEILTKMQDSGITQKIIDHELVVFPNDKKTILSISSSNADSPWGTGINKAFREFDEKIETYSINLNTDGITNRGEEWLNKISLVRADFVGKKPDVIFVSDNEALEFIKEFYYTLFVGVPVVFCGINDYHSTSIEGYEKYFTGVAEEISAADLLDIMLKLFPNTKDVFIINDFTPTGIAWKKDLETQLHSLSTKVNLEYSEDISMADLTAKISSLYENTLILNGNYSADLNGQYFSEEEAQKLFYQSSPVPIFGLKSTDFGFGQIGGKYVDSVTQGQLAATIVKEVLDGASVADIPVTAGTAQENQWKFDLKQLDKANITKKTITELVPAEFTNGTVSFFKAHPATAIPIMGLILILILSVAIFANLTYIMRKRNTALIELQKNLISAEDLLEKDKAIKDVKEYTESLIESSPIGYALVSNQVIVESNQFVKNMIGLEQGSDLNQHPELAAVCQDEKQKTITLKTPANKQNRFYVNTANVEYLEEASTVLWCVDAEEYEKQNDAIVQLQKEFEKIIDTLPLPLAILDMENLQIQYCNDTFINIFDLDSLQEAMGVSMQSCFPDKQSNGEDSMTALKNQVDWSFNSSSAEKFEWQYALKNDTTLNTMTFEIPILYKTSRCIIIVPIDISEELLREDMLKNLAEKEREASKLKSSFLVNVSHEIRTPMNAIIGLSEVKLLGNKNAEGYNALRKINDSAESLLMIINDILDFSKLEADKLQLQKEPFSVLKTITESMELASLRIKEKPLEIFAMLSNAVPKSVTGDKNRIKQVLQNILDNATKFTDQGTVKLSIDVAKVSGELITLRFTIADTGIGMTENELEKLCVPFEQFRNDIHSKYAGTGLGGAIIKQLVDLMGGTMSVKSQVGAGTTFIVELPFSYDALPSNSTGYKKINVQIQTEKKSSSNMTSTTELKSTPSIVSADLKDKKILLCEDNRVNQNVAMAMLEVYGTTASIANNGREAIDLLEKETFDIVLMDIHMPVLDGFETTKEIRSSTKSYRNIPIIAMTGDVMEEAVAKCLDCGMSSHLEKPIRMEKLYAELCKQLLK